MQIMLSGHDEKQNIAKTQPCEVCGVELSEEQSRAGITVCGQDCAQELDRRSGRSLKEIHEELLAEANAQPLESGRLENAGAELLKRYPKLWELVWDELERMRRDPAEIMGSFVNAWESGTLVATTVNAQRSAARTAEWYKTILQGPVEKGRVERVMGLRGRGKTPALQAARERSRDQYLFSEMILLRSLGWNMCLTVEEAAKMVCAVCEKADPTGWKEWGITPKALAGKFERSNLCDREFVTLTAELEPMTFEDAQQWVKEFPPNSLPPRLRKFILRPAS
jgi:hypothetical protein